jgi:hypothetical protein
MSQVMLRPLAGEGLKDNDIVAPAAVITAQNVKEYAVPAQRLTQSQRGRSAVR